VFDLFRGFRAVFFKRLCTFAVILHAILFLVIPLLQMVVLGLGIDTNIRQVNTVVFTPMAAAKAANSSTASKIPTPSHSPLRANDRDLNDEIIAGRARVGIKIPVDYSDRSCTRLARKSSFSSTAPILPWPVRPSMSPPPSGSTNLSAASCRIALKWPSRCAPASLQSGFPLAQFFLPGLTAVLLLNVTTFLTAFSIVREKERGTLEQLFVTPVRPLDCCSENCCLTWPSALPNSARSSPSCASSFKFLSMATSCCSLILASVPFRLSFHRHSRLQ